MKYITIYHANLNYAYLTADRYEFVIRASYELIIDTMARLFPRDPYVFEASGFTLEQIATRTPDVLDKLRRAIDKGVCEFMGSPYAHPMLPNFPYDDGLKSIQFSNDVYKCYLGFVPKSFWNPECGWRRFIPAQVAAAGYKNLLGDFEAYSRSLGADGAPLRPEIYEKEHTDDPAFYNFGFAYDLPGHERAIHFPFASIDGAANGALRVFLRTDRVAQFGVRFFMGMPDYTRARYLALIRKFSRQKKGEPEGALIVFADDAEYVGTNGWFRLKYQNKPDNVFEPTPESEKNLIGLVGACKKMGGFITFDDACRSLPPLPDPLAFDDDSAWHGARASTWADTPMAKLFRPWQDLVRAKLTASALSDEKRNRAWFHLTNSYNSDGQWPPTLPDAPHIIHPNNYAFNFENLLMAELLAGGVNRTRLTVDPLATLETILGPQQELVLKKARRILRTSKKKSEKLRAKEAVSLIETSRDIARLKREKPKLLYPMEYAIRADALVKARRLVGGVLIEKVDT